MNSEPTRPTPTTATLILGDGDMMGGCAGKACVNDRNLLTCYRCHR